MILPKKLFDQIEYFEYSKKQVGNRIVDVFTIHFNQWYKRRRVITIDRDFVGFKEDGETPQWRITPSAADLYNQLNDYAISTFEEKLDSVTQKYEKHEDNDNVLVLKPRPKDIDD